MLLCCQKITEERREEGEPARCRRLTVNTSSSCENWRHCATRSIQGLACYCSGRQDSGAVSRASRLGARCRKTVTESTSMELCEKNLRACFHFSSFFRMKMKKDIQFVRRRITKGSTKTRSSRIPQCGWRVPRLAASYAKSLWAHVNRRIRNDDRMNKDYGVKIWRCGETLLGHWQERTRRI